MQLQTASGMSSGYYVRLDSIKLGDIQLSGVEAAVMPGDFPHEILLGMSFLNRVEMIRNEDHLLLRKKY